MNNQIHQGHMAVASKFRKKQVPTRETARVGYLLVWNRIFQSPGPQTHLCLQKLPWEAYTTMLNI